MAFRELASNGWQVRLDMASQVLNVEVPESTNGWNVSGEDDEILPTMPRMGTGPVSAATLLLKAKQFDDGLMAAVEVAAQQGVGQFVGKVGLLRGVAKWLGGDPAAVAIIAAGRLGNTDIDISEGLVPAVDSAIVDFKSDEHRSKPQGFYTWSPGLEGIFRQDRFLQQPLDQATGDAMSAALGRTQGGRAAYVAILRLAAQLASPLEGKSLLDSGDNRAFFPASRSTEGRLIERLYGDRPVPAGFELMTELIRRIRCGEIDLTPEAGAGWYDRQTWALEPLVTPDRTAEAQRLILGPRYRQHLEGLFRAALALARETHVKQMAVAMAGSAGPSSQLIYVRPDLAVEPVPEMYVRRAAGYQFVRELLDEAFGEAWKYLNRMTAEGPVETRLGDELDQMENLFRGAGSSSYRDLGLEPPAGDANASAVFARWRAALAGDPDVAKDARMMVPVSYDRGRRQTKVWAFLGWRTVPVTVKYEQPPAVVTVEPERVSPQPTSTDDRYAALRRKFRKVPEPTPAVAPRVVFRGAQYDFAEPVMAEVHVTRLLDRDEFRNHCDRHRNPAAIVRTLG
jgi:hypothetical protein